MSAAARSIARDVELDARRAAVDALHGEVLEELGAYDARFPGAGAWDPQTGAWCETVGTDDRYKVAHDLWQAGLYRLIHAGSVEEAPEEFAGDARAQILRLLADAEQAFTDALAVLRGLAPVPELAVEGQTIDDEIARERRARTAAVYYDGRPTRVDQLVTVLRMIAARHRDRGSARGPRRRRAGRGTCSRRGPPSSDEVPLDPRFAGVAP